MQSFRWYMARLRTMSPEEISWRLRTSLRTRLDYAVAPLRRRPLRLERLVARDTDADPSDLRLCEVAVGAWNAQRDDVTESRWCGDLRGRADRIAAGYLTYFDRVDQCLGNPIDWNRDHSAGRAAPMGFAPSIDYRDFDLTGDCKLVWEPNRHHQLVVLGRAYRASGERRYAEAVVAQVESWLAACPFGMGMNWRSPLELAIRLINWVWAYDLIRDAGVISEGFRERWLRSIYWHLWEIGRNFSRGSSAGNHLIGEAAGALIGASYFNFFKGAERWRRESHDILEREILRQTFSDGGSREQALGYHLFITQFFLLAGLTGRRSGFDFSDAYWARLDAMFRFVEQIQAGGEMLPMFGDNDDGYVLDLGAGKPDGHAIIALGAAWRAAHGTEANEASRSEAAYWLFGNGRAPQASAATVGPLRSVAFPETGYYLLQHGEAGQGISVGFDCGPLGLAPMAGHGHADALSVTLRAFGQDVLVDPGTYDYFTHPRWRSYFRSTRAHNTIEIDGRDQSEMRGPFLWSNHAAARLLAWEPTETGGSVCGEHDGYARLSQPVVHRRHVCLDGATGEIEIRDELEGHGEHRATVSFHLAEHCRLVPKEERVFGIAFGAGSALLTLDGQLAIRVWDGSEEPISGWVSRGYHQKSPATTVTGTVTFRDRLVLVSRLKVSR